MVFADNISYLVQRTDADFAALDKKLLKHFPTLTPVLNVTEKSSSSSSSSKSPVKPESLSIEKNMSDLNFYLNKLLLKNEIIQSSYFLDFIDEGITSSELFLARKLTSVPSVYDILLSKEDTEYTVLRTKEIALEVPIASYIVLWRFSTIDYDIGFSVELDGVQKVEFSRVPSHQKVICGSLEVKEPQGICHLKWDNTYSKFHLKTLRLSFAIVSPEQYDVACETVNELYKTLKVYDKQRLVVKRCVLKRAEKAGLLHYNEQQEDFSLLEAADSIQSEILDIRAQLAHAKEQLVEAHSYIEELEEGKRIVEDARDQVLESWKFTLSQLGAAKEQNARLTRENKEMKAKLEAAESLTQSKRSESLPLSPSIITTTAALPKIIKDTVRNDSADDDEVML